VQEFYAFAGYAVDVRRLVAHEALGVRAEVRNADVVAPDDEDVRLLAAGRCCRLLRLPRKDAVAVIADAAASVVPPSRMLRRFSACSCGFDAST
jgi:hypothetical protein